MFRTANRVTRPEKALILGFMAGSRDNPCPHLGSIVTIKLSENQENVPQDDNTYLTMIVETHFQVSYFFIRRAVKQCRTTVRLQIFSKELCLSSINHLYLKMIYIVKDNLGMFLCTLLIVVTTCYTFFCIRPQFFNPTETQHLNQKKN